MLTLAFDTEALTRVRFAISPILEATLSVEVLYDPAKAAIPLPWVERARERTGELDLTTVRLLGNRDVGYSPDFINPPPSTPTAELERELEVMVRTPPAQIREEVLRSRRGRVPRELTEFIEHPRRAVRRLAELL